MKPIKKVEYGNEIIKEKGKDYILYSEYRKLSDDYYNKLEKVYKELEKSYHIMYQFEEYLKEMYNKTQDIKYLDDLNKLWLLRGDKEW